MNTENENKIITMELRKALGILAGAILVAGVGGAGVAYNTLNTDHFILSSVKAQLDQDTKDLQTANEVISEFRVSQNDIRQIKVDIQEIKVQQKTNTSLLDKILGKLNE